MKNPGISVLPKANEARTEPRPLSKLPRRVQVGIR